MLSVKCSFAHTHPLSGSVECYLDCPRGY